MSGWQKFVILAFVCNTSLEHIPFDYCKVFLCPESPSQQTNPTSEIVHGFTPHSNSKVHAATASEAASCCQLELCLLHATCGCQIRSRTLLSLLLKLLGRLRRSPAAPAWPIHWLAVPGTPAPSTASSRPAGHQCAWISSQPSYPVNQLQMPQMVFVLGCTLHAARSHV